MTLGTTPVETIINSYIELFKRNFFEEVVFIRTNNKNSIEQEIRIKEILGEKTYHVFEIKNYEDLGELLKELVFVKDKESFVSFIKRREKEEIVFFLDITGGTKIMSSALISILINNKNLEEIIYIGGSRDSKTGKVIGLPKVQYTSKNILSFFSSFFIYLEENLKNKNYLVLSNFLSKNRDYFFNQEWKVFVDLIDFYAYLIKGKFDLLENSLFLSENYDQSVFKKVVENSDEIENFFKKINKYLKLRKKDLDSNQIRKRALFELEYFFDLLKNNLYNRLPLETLAYFYTFFEKLVNFVLIHEGFKRSGFEFVFEEKTYYLSEIDNKQDKKIVGLQKKIKLIQNKELKEFLKKNYDELIGKIRNLSIVGHGEIYPGEEVFEKVQKFIEQLFSRFGFLWKNDGFGFFYYPKFKIKNIFF